MNIEQAVELIYTGLVSEESVPVKLRAYHELDRELLAQVQEALDSIASLISVTSSGLSSIRRIIRCISHLLALN